MRWLTNFLMISASKEQLQQQLEYTLLKPDCHCWGISKMQSETLEVRYAIKFCFELGKNATETYGILQTAFRTLCMDRVSVFEWHKRFKEGREFDERCGTSKEVRTPELIGQRSRVRVIMLRFWRSSGRDSVGRGQHSSNRVGGISTWTMHQSTTPSLSQTIWLMLYSHLQRHNDKDAGRKTHDKDAGRTSLEKYSPLTLLQGFDRVVQSCMWEGVEDRT